MLYLLENSHLGIPVPKVYAYCFDPKHMAGPFMIIEDIVSSIPEESDVNANRT